MVLMEKQTYIVIPSLNPDEKLAKTIEGLKAVGYKRFVLVDDGSDRQNKKYFPAETVEIKLLVHRANRGKGAALKTAFRYILENCSDVAAVITVDGDGQHLPQDVKLCETALTADKTMVLGCRNFSKSEVPLRSRFGNNTTSFIFKTLCGIKISDTQTGLRAFSASLLPELLEIKGVRFEYETNMLLNFSQKDIAIKEVGINTVYIEENKTSHFRPVRDSLQIYKFILAYFFSSCVSFLTDILLFYVLCHLFGAVLGNLAEAASTVGARIVSSILNFNLNRKTVFESRADVKKTVLKYFVLAILQVAVSAGVVTALSIALQSTPFISTLLKILVDTALFLISFRVQRCWVFSEKTQKKTRKTPKKLTVKSVIGRSVLVVVTAIFMVLVTVVSACLLICYGPSESLKNMLVISAKQASATKWIPELFLSKKAVEKIMLDSTEVLTDSVEMDDYLTEEETADEWADAIDGMKLIFLNEPRFKAYLLMIRDPKRVTVGVSSSNFSTAVEGIRMTDVVVKYDCIAAINGGEFADIGGTGTGAQPMGLTYSGGKLVWDDGAPRTFIGFDKNDKLVCRERMSRAEAEELGIRDAVCFQNGNVLIQEQDGEIRLHYGNKNSGAAQRTAIGQRADGTVLMLVTDGRTAESIGATRDDVIGVMARYGAVNAAMLDGGSSAMMYYENYFDKYPVNREELDTFQQFGLVNRYKAFMRPRRIPTYFIVSKVDNNG